MRKFTNQRGLAVLEVMIVAAIVAIFATAAVPKMARIIDKVQLDYEMKHLYSTLNLARSIGKNSAYKNTIDAEFAKQDGNVEIDIRKDINRYYILRNNDTGINKCYEHFLPQDFNLSHNEPKKDTLPITFSNAGRYSDCSSRTITLTSKFGKVAYIKINTVGRWRGTYDK